MAIVTKSFDDAVYKLAPIQQTDDMIIAGFESVPCYGFTDINEVENYEAMSGCQQAAHRAKLCYAAMLAATPTNLPDVITHSGEPVAFDDYPEFHISGMGCGLEDRDITDRYEAMRYGWDEAIEAVAERIKSAALFTHPPQASEAKPTFTQAEYMTIQMMQDSLEDKLMGACDDEDKDSCDLINAELSVLSKLVAAARSAS